MILLLVSQALASTWTAEDIVLARDRGLPDETVRSIADSVGTDPATTVYLLRRGLSPEQLTVWGVPVADADTVTAAALGPLSAPVPEVTDVAAQARGAATVNRVLSEDLTRIETDPTRDRHRRGGAAGIAIGAALTALGGVGVLYGFHGVGVYEDVESCSSGLGIPEAPACSSAWAPSGNIPDMLAIGGGGLLLVGAGFSFDIGARHLRLAGSRVELPIAAR